ncbi:hypothetical protein O987_18600 [Comamonas testosteroni TK102]|uniref:Uncharacterized protein n=1 Tax=Comamonas testosteroni TK102 TaxID=1392005 RepID=A0A076PQ13_COMTE|nr:hypothetical protein O987_18600 [Comamonas testosteroni TK102]
MLSLLFDSDRAMRCLARQRMSESNRCDLCKSLPAEAGVDVDGLAAARQGIADGLRTRKMELCNSLAHNLWRHASAAQETEVQAKLVA